MYFSSQLTSIGKAEELQQPEVVRPCRRGSSEQEQAPRMARQPPPWLCTAAGILCLLSLGAAIEIPMDREYCSDLGRGVGRGSKDCLTCLTCGNPGVTSGTSDFASLLSNMKSTPRRPGWGQWIQGSEVGLGDAKRSRQVEWGGCRGLLSPLHSFINCVFQELWLFLTFPHVCKSGNPQALSRLGSGLLFNGSVLSH